MTERDTRNEDRVAPDDELVIHVIYSNPSDHPGKFVVRRWLVHGGGPVPHDHLAIADTLDEARAAIPAGKVRIPRFDEDDHVIVESWL